MKTQHVAEDSADGVAHLVFLCRRAPVRFRRIRNLLFSDLRRNEEGLLHDEHKRWRIVANGVLLSFWKEKVLIVALSGQVILTANQPQNGTHHFSARTSVLTSDSVDAVEGRFVPGADTSDCTLH
ncbi:TPA: hypothetical protein ACPTV7_004973 [Escherichia coli]|nr:hypothetical protein [Enterobacter hormaechei]UPG34589.1 hypothetical protein KC840_000055 [Enterobacter hormaechei]